MTGLFSAVLSIIKKAYLHFHKIDSSIGLFCFGGILFIVLLQPVPLTYGNSLSSLLPSALLILGFTLNYHLHNSKSLAVPFLLFFECMVIIWFWQGLLLFLDQNYLVNTETSNPAFLLLNEVIQYKREFNLSFLANFHENRKSLIVFVALMAELSLFGLLIRQITFSRNRKADSRVRASTRPPENPLGSR